MKKESTPSLPPPTPHPNVQKGDAATHETKTQMDLNREPASGQRTETNSASKEPEKRKVLHVLSCVKLLKPCWKLFTD